MDFATDAQRWQAVLDRETAAEGQFYYAVRTTGVFCRPSCPARHPRRENVSFFETSEAAQAAGYRACQRCKPLEIAASRQAIARVLELLETREPTPTLAELGREVGWSPFHLQRSFKRATGVSPRAYAAALKAERLRAGLKAGESVTGAMLDAGYGSSRSLYAASGTALAMTPGAYRRGGAGERIMHAAAESPLGRFTVAATERGVCALRFGDDDEALLQELASEFPRASWVHEPTALAPHIAAVQAHLEGRSPALELPLDVKATDFQRRVWALLRDIPYGETRSYTQIAEALGAPTAVRAVARACATNPVALVVPCHRVVRANGDLSGYRWGLDRKQALLDLEKG